MKPCLISATATLPNKAFKTHPGQFFHNNKLMWNVDCKFFCLTLVPCESAIKINKHTEHCQRIHCSVMPCTLANIDRVVSEPLFSRQCLQSVEGASLFPTIVTRQFVLIISYTITETKKVNTCCFNDLFSLFCL